MESFGDSTISTIYDRRKSNTFLALNRFAKPNTGDNENCRDRINFNKRSSVSSKPKPIKPTESYPPVFDSDKFAVPRARSESAVIPRPDPPVVMRDRTSTVALRNRSSTCQLSGEAFMERRNSRHRASISSISNLYNNMNISEGGAWASRRSSVASMESGCSNFSLELSEKEWMVRSAVGDCNTLSRLLLQDRNFALFKDFVSGYTGLHWACKLGRPDMAKIMLECGADVNARSSSGQTPLHLAAQCGYLELVALLVEHHKANIRIRDYSGRRPIQYASHEASPQLRFWLTPKDDQLHKYADKISQQLAQQRKFSMKSYSLNSDMRDDNSPIRRPTLNAAWKKMMGPTSFKASFNSKSKLKNNLKTSDPHKDFTVKKTESIPPSSNNKESNDRPRSKTLPPGIKTAVLYL